MIEWIAGAYFAIALIVFIFHACIGPITLGLAILRGLFWPLWMLGMISGERMPMD